MSSHRYNTRFQAKKAIQAAKAVEAAKAAQPAPSTVGENKPSSQYTGSDPNFAKLSSLLIESQSTSNEDRLDVMVRVFEHVTTFQYLWNNNSKFRGVLTAKIDDILERQIPDRMKRVFPCECRRVEFQEKLVLLKVRIESLKYVMNATPLLMPMFVPKM